MTRRWGFFRKASHNFNDINDQSLFSPLLRVKEPRSRALTMADLVGDWDPF